ncbi:uncharacterized protein [Neodiprion pinetum]|uniref:uncharacterized protein LOC124176340 isoform X2 n=1 Tax=Neodiprion fabricii TaxID=2872261 RepID=UPI001ED8D5BB|nr:uncharacterized protein LOC124176340 isoform X2 [Neodiprion fabricii]XP_046469221.1 uncharacterized protein LOC124212800 isoform X2 [Neodiprion pinetum]
MWRRILMSIAFTANLCLAQDYEVSEIQCSLAGSGSDLLTAKIRRPVGFKGAPLFADDRAANPLTDPSCQIRPDPTDPQEDNYLLKVTDFSRCGILKRNEFIHLRVWFPAFPGVVMLADQELILMCRPPEPTLLRHKAAGFAGTFPHGARVSGVVEETPGRLEYEVALYREAVGNASDPNAASQTVDQAVPIGTKLQLRARISSESAWGHIKLLEVTVSPDPDEPHAPGSVALVKDGCRNRDFASIIPHQPARYRGKKNEVFLDFEAFLLSSMRERSTLWIHSQIKACMEAQDCQPEFCLDLFEPAGHGKRRRRSLEPDVQLPSAQKLVKKFNDSVPFTKFKENIEYTVLMPGDLYEKVAGLEGSCGSFFYLASGLGVLLVFSAFIMCYLASRLHSVTSGATHNKTIDDLVRERARKFSETQGYTGRSTVQ